MKKKILMVTGASSEVGCALIDEVHADYSVIWAHYNENIDAVMAMRDHIGEKIVPVRADFSDFDDLARMAASVRESGNMPDHLVHLSAPRARNGNFHKWKWDDFQREADISVRPAVMLLSEFIPQMCKKRYGKIIIMLSSFVCGVSPKYQSPYIVSKFALYGLMRNLAAEYTDKGIAVNAVSPDMMDTAFNCKIPRGFKELNAENSPLKRNLRAKDAVPAISFLLSDKADAISGQNLPVTAGMDVM